MNTIERYDQAKKKLGETMFNELILTERAYNQKYWAGRLRNALKPLKEGQKKQPGQIKRTLSIIEAMEKDSK